MFQSLTKFIANQSVSLYNGTTSLFGGRGDKNIAKGCKTTAFGKLFIFNHLQFSAKLQVFLKLQKIFFRVFSPLLLRYLHPITVGTSVIAIVVHTPHTLPNFAPHTLANFQSLPKLITLIINHFYSHCRGDWQIALTNKTFRTAFV